MAEKKNNQNKTASARKSSRQRTKTSTHAGTKKTISKKNTEKMNERTKRLTTQQTYTEPIMDDVKMIITLLVSILLLLSVFGCCGRWGDKIAYLLFGLFGILAYAVPFFLFIGVAFEMANRGNALAKIKIAAVVVFVVMLLSVISISGDTLDISRKITEGFYISAASHHGGGLLGYIFSWLLYPAVGRAGAILIFIAVMLISAVLITGKRLLVRIGQMILAGCKALKERLSDYMAYREEERIKKAEQEALKLSEEDEEEDYSDDELEEEPKKKKNSKRFGSLHKKASNILFASANVNEEDDSIEEKEQPEADDSIEEKEQPAADDSKENAKDEAGNGPKPLDTFDAGKKLQPLSIKVPEFMKGGPITESSMGEKVQAAEKKVTEPPAQLSKNLQFEIKGENLINDVEEHQDIEAKTEEKPVQKVIEKTEVQTSSEDEEKMQIEETEVEKYVFPPLELLDSGVGSTKTSMSSLQQTALKLQQTFESFGVGVQVTNVSCGPAVTRYEIQPDQGVKVSRIVALSDDIKLNLAVADIRMEAPIPGKAAVGIEVPNAQKEMVKLRDLLESDQAKKMTSKLAFAVGKDIGGQTVVANIEKMPHMLIAGATGSGKSVCINTIIMSILYRADPNEVKMIMIDPKVVELNVYNGLPHLLIPVVTDPKKAAGALNWAVTTMMERYNKFAEVGAKDIKSYNARVEQAGNKSENYKKMAQIIIIIDELADLMMVAQSEVEDAICRLAQLARAAGIHLVIATQRPSVNVITGLIKANVPSRIAFAVSSGVDSRTILDMNGAEKLLGNGDMLFAPQGTPKPQRVQGAFVSEEEIKRVTDFIKGNCSSTPVYSEDITKTIESNTSVMSNNASRDDRDIYFEEAGRFVIQKEKASIGMLQRVYKIGFNRAARIVDQLSDAGVVGPEIGTKPRQILMTMEEFEAFLQQNH